MKAYRAIAETGEAASADTLALCIWEREHSKHRGIHIGELAALQTAAKIAISIRDEKVLEKMNSEQEMNRRKEKFDEAAKKKWMHYKKKLQNGKYKKRNGNYKRITRRVRMHM